MGIRDILVYLDNSTASAARLDVAVAYARKHGARLRGLYLITHSFYEPRALGETADSEKVEQIFTSITSEAGISAEWVFEDCSVMGINPSDLIIMHSYYTDLIIIGQPDLSAPTGNIPTDLAERVILSSGRPVLIVPYSGKFQTAGNRIMIAWKAGRESIRAVNDSLQHLQKALSVLIVEGITTSESDNRSLESIRSFLLKHNVKVALESINSGNFPVGDMLLNTASDKNIDLLVMGVFAPNRRGKLEMSPVARHVLKHLTVPVLMSH